MKIFNLHNLFISMSVKLFPRYQGFQRVMSVLTLYHSFQFTSRSYCKPTEKKRKFSGRSKVVANSKQDQQFPKSLNSRQKPNSYFYIKDTKDAECIALHLCSGWKNGYVLEANPGPGILTKAILNNGISHLRVFEKDGEFLPLLKELSVAHPNLEVIPEDIMFLPSLEARVSERESSLCDSFFANIPEYAWEDGIPCRFFSIISNKKTIKFLRYLLAVLPSRSSLFSFGRCEFFLLLSETEYQYMKAEPKGNFSTYRWITVLYNLFFETECLQKYSSEIMYPLPSRGKNKVTKEQHFYLMKLTPRSDLFSSVVNDNKLPEFYFFVRHHLIKRTGLVIPTMEGWIPSCGPRLIKEGMNVFTKFGDLSPKQILVLFNQFSSWPEYEDSSFCTALQRFYGKDSLPYEDEESA